MAACIAGTTVVVVGCAVERPDDSVGSASQADSAPTITVSSPSVTAGDPVTATRKNYAGAGNWLGLFMHVDDVQDVIDWTPIPADVAFFSWTVAMPFSPGDYEFREYMIGGPHVSTSPIVTVLPPDEPIDPIPPRVPTTLIAASMTTKTAGAAADDTTWNLSSEGYVSQSVQFGSDRDYAITGSAFADIALGIGANLELRIDGEAVASTSVDSSSPADYPFQVTVTAGVHEVAIAFTNDYWDPDVGVDRNLYVSTVSISTAKPPPPSCAGASGAGQ
jgi:hypothetical protein